MRANTNTLRSHRTAKQPTNRDLRRALRGLDSRAIGAIMAGMKTRAQLHAAR